MDYTCLGVYVRVVCCVFVCCVWCVVCVCVCVCICVCVCVCVCVGNFGLLVVFLVM